MPMNAPECALGEEISTQSKKSISGEPHLAGQKDPDHEHAEIFTLQLLWSGKHPWPPSWAFEHSHPIHPLPWWEPIENPTGNAWSQVSCPSFLILSLLASVYVSMAFYFKDLLGLHSPAFVICPYYHILIHLPTSPNLWITAVPTELSRTYPIHTSNPPHCWPGVSHPRAFKGADVTTIKLERHSINTT